jgi:hypothetical protein
MKALAKTLPALCLLGLALASPAQAAFGLNGFDVNFEQEGGAPATKAGSHPFAMTTSFHVNFHEEGSVPTPDGEMKDLEVELPVGFAGNPTAVPTCTRAQFREMDPITGTSACPDDTAVGHVVAEVVNPDSSDPSAFAPVFNLQRPRGVAAELGFVVAREPVTIDVVLKKGEPYNVSAAIINTPQVVKFYGSELTIWGNPASHAHDSERGSCLFLGGSCPVGPEVGEKPFITLPRACTPPLQTTYRATSWQEPEAPPVEGVSETSLEPSECEELEFGGEIEAQPSSASAEAPSGLDFELHIDDPGLGEPEGSAHADIEEIATLLPEGVSANPSAAEGQEACSFAQYEAESLTAQSCPEASKLGTVRVDTPLLENEPLQGQVYLASQADNPFGTLLALYIVIKDPKLGILVKQAGRIDPDPRTGRLTTTVRGLPQLPFSDIKLHLRSGPRAPLVLPSRCGTYTTEAILTPYNGKAPLAATSTFNVTSGVDGGPCQGAELPFGPTFTAGTLNNSASTYSPFNMRFTRKDGEQEMTRLSAILPSGVVPKLAGIAKCSDAAIAAAKGKSGRQELAAPSCPATSLIGHLSAGAGVGSDLTYVPGSVYLAGPFGGDPLSAVAIVPAVAGPLDVGTVVTRVGLTLNPDTYLGEIESSHSDPFPRILAGVPLRLRDLRITADRPQFTLNATGCEAEQAQAQLFGVPTVAALAVRYQAQGCGSLAFNPKLSLKLLGSPKRAGHPRLLSSVTYPYPSGPGYSNIANAVVTLPRGEQIDNAHINNPCTRVQFNANQCPPKSILGTAKATSPLLDEPLEGPVYFRSNGGERLLPDIVADLHGIVHIVLVGEVTSKKARLRTTFSKVPDAPVTKFDLNLFGGKRGLLTNNRNLCRSPQKADLALIGQNNTLRQSTLKVKTSCGGGKRAKGGRGR